MFSNWKLIVLTLINLSGIGESFFADEKATRREVNLLNEDNVEASKKKVSVNIEALISSYETHMSHYSILYGITKMASESINYKNTSLCQKQLLQIQQGILEKKAWAIKVLDAAGTINSGFLFGQNFWFGSRDSCTAAQSPIQLQLSKHLQHTMYPEILNEAAPFDMDYRLIYLGHKSQWQLEFKIVIERVLHIGICLPSSCTAQEFEMLAMQYVEHEDFIKNDFYETQPKVMYSKNLKLSEDFFQQKAWKIFSTLIIFTSFMILAAYLIRSTNTQIFDGYSNTKAFITCFDLQQNCKQMFDVEACNSIGIIDGLRSYCAILVIFGHAILYTYFTVNNKLSLLLLMERTYFITLSVDIFFTISGFLKAYNEKPVNEGSQQNFGRDVYDFLKQILQRYFKLAPLYYVSLVVITVFTSYINEVSVYHISLRADKCCSQYWWRHLLFIQSFFSYTTMCGNWTWSLSADMFFFVVVTLVLIIYKRNSNYGYAGLLIMLLANISWIYFIGFKTNYRTALDVVLETGDDIYINPIVRITPYILGVIIGCYCRELKVANEICDKKSTPSSLHLKKTTALFILLFLAITGICILLKLNMLVFQAITEFILMRIFLSALTCWMITTYIHGGAQHQRRWWFSLLEVKIFRHLSRICYASSLMNPLVIMFFASLTNSSIHLDPVVIYVQCGSIFSTIYFVSVVSSLIFEMPYNNLYKLIMYPKKHKSN